MHGGGLAQDLVKWHSAPQQARYQKWQVTVFVGVPCQNASTGTAVWPMVNSEPGSVPGVQAEAKPLETLGRVMGKALGCTLGNGMWLHFLTLGLATLA